MLASLKPIVKRFPGIRGLIHQREQLHQALIHASTARDQLQQALVHASTERDQLRQALVHATAERDQLQQENAHATAEREAMRQACGFVPPGHYYSPIPDIAAIRQDEARIFGTVPRQIAGIDLRETAQMELLEQFAKFYPDIPFGAHPKPGLRYHYENQSYAYSDGILLHCMLRHLKPRRLIEIGSGFSSCATLDTDQLFLGGQLQATFIEPYPELLMSLIQDADRERMTIIPKRLQDVDLDVFRALEAGDVLFVDSTHVSRIDSDVNRVFFDILPALAPGVVIHFHDIFHPFEYPKEWIYFGRAWNELYMLRTFLQYNDSFRVMLMNTFMAHFHRPFFEKNMPLCLVNTGGSIWLEKH